MMSIKESVHQLLEDQISRLGMQGEYPALTEELRIEIEHLKATDPDSMAKKRSYERRRALISAANAAG